MTFEIHYEINEHEDYYTISADTLEELHEINKAEMEKRNLEPEKNNCWSKEIT